MAKMDNTIKIEANNLTRTVQAMLEGMGMHAENDVRRLNGESPAYREVDFLHLTAKYNLDDETVDDLLSDSEKAFVETRLSEYSAAVAEQANSCESL